MQTSATESSKTGPADHNVVGFDRTRRQRRPHAHIVHPDAKICQTVSVVLMLEGYATSMSTDPQTLGATLAEQPAPDVVVAPLNGHSLECLIWAEAASRRARSKIILLAPANAAPEDVVSAIRLGAADVLSTPFDAERLIAAANLGVTAETEEPGTEDLPSAIAAALTPRERQVCAMMATGCRTKVIAAKLNLSARTVEGHRLHIFDKTGARSAAQLAALVANQRSARANRSPG